MGFLNHKNCDVVMLKFLLVFCGSRISQLLRKLSRFQRINLYFFIFHQINDYYKWNLLFIYQIYNFNSMMNQLVSSNYPSAPCTLARQG